MQANEAPFVYQCTELIENDDDVTNAIVDYCIDAIRAIGLKWGPTHTEIKMTSDGPRLIEINCRRVTVSVIIITYALLVDSITIRATHFLSINYFLHILLFGVQMAQCQLL